MERLDNIVWQYCCREPSIAGLTDLMRTLMVSRDTNTNSWDRLMKTFPIHRMTNVEDDIEETPQHVEDDTEERTSAVDDTSVDGPREPSKPRDDPDGPYSPSTPSAPQTSSYFLRSRDKQ